MTPCIKRKVLMKTSITSLLLVLARHRLSVLACDVPVAPPTPDGSNATLEEMIAAQGKVKAFKPPMQNIWSA